eukprot:715200-Rhodomonas_salina.1
MLLRMLVLDANANADVDADADGAEACIWEHITHCPAVRQSSPCCPCCNEDLGPEPVITVKQPETERLEQHPCFRQVQQLCLDTGAVKAVFPSASSASRRFPATRANRILQVRDDGDVG